MSPLLLQGVWPLTVVLCSRDNNSGTYYNTCRLSLNGTTQKHLLSYIRIHCHHIINVPTNICIYSYILPYTLYTCYHTYVYAVTIILIHLQIYVYIYVYTNYVSMLVGWCHVRTVKQCLLIRAQPKEGEYVGQCVHGCKQVNYHTHDTRRMLSIVGQALHCIASIACAIPMATFSSKT